MTTSGPEKVMSCEINSSLYGVLRIAFVAH